MRSTLDAHRYPGGVRKTEDDVKPWRKKVVCDGSSEPEQEAKRHLETYRNMRHLRDALHHRCASLLKDKVLSQRLVLQQRDETTRVKCEAKNKTKQKQKKRAFFTLQHNDSYLQSLPKTSYYQIFDLQKQLVQRGHLKTSRELEDFHRCIDYNSPPSQMQRNLQDVRKKMLGSRSSAVDLTSQQKTESDPCSPEDGGDEEDDLCCSRLLEHRSGSGESKEKDAVEQMFFKMKVPTFTTLQPNIMRIFQSKMPDLIIAEIPEKSRKAEIYLRRLRQMHHLCLNNMSICQRLVTDGECNLD
ncbi:hypothetical protein JOB18_033195 [Solea senegalensis]|uniref:Uncharacterized protein n=1 Tax=Solea senegalensis TaxID=28829 RepID=A0AAV6S635_SOLSE|nr:hypothetical protein JOB18_033195 [Solea senegalensis]